MQMKLYGHLFNALTSDKPREYFEAAKEYVQNKKGKVEEGIVIYHEKYVSGSNFTKEQSSKKKWHNNFFNMKGKYQDDLE